MHQSKLIRLLRAFSEAEIREIRQMLKSPWVNDGKRPVQVQALMEHLSGQHPGYEGEAVGRERVFRVVFPEQGGFDAGKLDKVASELTGILRKFIAFQRVGEQSSQEFWLEQARFARLRGLDAEFRQATERIEKMQREAGKQGQAFFAQKFSLEAERVRHLSMAHDWRGDLNLPATIRALDLYYLVAKLEYSSHLLSLSANTRLSAPQPFLPLGEVLEMARRHCLHIPIAAAYFHAFSLLLHPLDEGQSEASRLLREVLQEHGTQFLPSTLRLLCGHLRNHISARYNRGDTACLPELFGLFKEHDQLGALVQEDSRILAGTLNSAVNVALKLGDHEWATGFLERHAERLALSDDADSIYKFNFANCLFHRGDFEAAERCLMGLQLREMLYKLAARRLEIKLLYEMDSPLLDARIDAFKVFLHEAKQTLTPDLLEPSNRFTDLMRQLLSPKTLGNAARIDKLLKNLSEKKAVAEREWLEVKLRAVQ